MRDPMVLCKYRSLRDERDFVRLEQIILDDQLYFATADKFNDPFEFRFLTDTCAGEQDQIRTIAVAFRRNDANLSWDEACGRARKVLATISAEQLSTLIESAARESTDALRCGPGILCLSEPNDEPLLWSHYADGHTGVCLEFDATNSTPFFANAQEVKYAEDVPIINPFLEESILSMEKALLTKAQCWIYEREWRVVDYTNGAGPRRFPRGSLRSVILGAQISPESETRVKEWAQTRTPALPIKRSKLDPRAYKLVIEKT